MIETKHTPGPWTASADRICGGLRIRIRAQERPLGQAKAPYSPIVTEVTSDWGISDAEAAASASLIAAAPELLAALRGVLPYMEAAEISGLIGDEECHGPVEAVRAALAKAEGRS